MSSSPLPAALDCLPPPPAPAGCFFPPPPAGCFCFCCSCGSSAAAPALPFFFLALLFFLLLAAAGGGGCCCLLCCCGSSSCCSSSSSSGCSSSCGGWCSVDAQGQRGCAGVSPQPTFDAGRVFPATTQTTRTALLTPLTPKARTHLVIGQQSKGIERGSLDNRRISLVFAALPVACSERSTTAVCCWCCCCCCCCKLLLQLTQVARCHLGRSQGVSLSLGLLRALQPALSAPSAPRDHLWRSVGSVW